VRIGGQGNGQTRGSDPVRKAGLVVKLHPSNTAPIVPGESLGGIALRQHITALDEMIMKNYWMHPAEYDWYFMSHIHELTYRIGNISICIDVRNGKVFKLIAHEGYKGKLFGKIAVGMSIEDAMTACPDLHYDEDDWIVRSRQHEGIVIDAEEIDPDPATVGTLPIRGIAVFVPEAFSGTGLRGAW
jgi:hypothetical protein